MALPEGENLTLTGAIVNSHVIYYIIYMHYVYVGITVSKKLGETLCSFKTREFALLYH